MNIRTVATVCLLAWASFACKQELPPLDFIRVDSGLISGQRTEDGAVLAFRGIPYAKPPVGNLRWKPPVAPDPWTDVLACDKFGASPMQAKPVPFAVYTSEYLIPESPISENCLTVNVWTPAVSVSDKLPVLVWIYGGGFSSGGSACPIYDGEALARKGIIVVSVNYRVGIFGFLAHPWLSQESPFGASGNYGILDQIAGLKWVQRNIAAFGGDPAKVTIAGQSAGSMSVNTLMASPQAKGLFRAVIGQSGASTTRTPLSKSEAEAQGLQLSEALGVQGLDALRALPADTLLARAGNGPGVILDGYVLPKPVPDLMAEGDYNDVPLMLGWNADEGFVFQLLNATGWEERLRATYPTSADVLLQQYPAVNDSIAAASQRAFSTHIMFGLPIYRWALSQSKHGKGTVFLYQFAHTPAGPDSLRKAGAHHTAEVPYVFANLTFVDRPWRPVDHKLSDLVSDYWVQFVKGANPNAEGLPVWVEFKPGDPTAMKFSSTAEDVVTGMVPVPDLSQMNALEQALQPAATDEAPPAE